MHREVMLAVRRKRRDALPACACLTYSSLHLTQRSSLAPARFCLGCIQWQSDAHILVSVSTVFRVAAAEGGACD